MSNSEKKLDDHPKCADPEASSKGKSAVDTPVMDGHSSQSSIQKVTKELDAPSMKKSESSSSDCVLSTSDSSEEYDESNTDEKSAPKLAKKHSVLSALRLSKSKSSTKANLDRSPKSVPLTNAKSNGTSILGSPQASPKKSFPTSTSMKMVNTIAKASMVPIRTGVNAVNMLSPSVPPNISSFILPQKEESEFSESTVNGISRSFAGFLTTASMYAGFQDIEDEDAEVESIRNRSIGKDYSHMDVKSCPPENANNLEILDDKIEEDMKNEYNNDNDNNTMSSAEEYESIISNDNKSRSDITLTNETIRNLPASFFKDTRRHGSEFELSIVKKIIESSEVLDKSQEEFLTNKAVAISNKLKEVFNIEDSSNFIGDYACWLMGDVLLQGHLYITTKHVLFFAFLPKMSKDSVARAGSLSVKSFSTLRMVRKWLLLRENTLSVYSSPKDLYFPELVIDLRTALRAETYGSKSTDSSHPVWIKIITENRTHWFQADNYDVAKSWVTVLKKHIFSSGNKGDQVAIKIPLQNIIDLELTSVVGITKNLRIKVIENAESFALDDYFIMFFSKGDSALADIRKAIENAGVELTGTVENTDEEDLRNSQLIKSRIELLKKSTSSVKSNYRAKEKKGLFREIRDSILSSDEEDYEGEDKNRIHESLDSAIGTKDGGIATTVLSKTKKIIPSRLRSKSFRLVPNSNNMNMLQNVEDSTHDSSAPYKDKEKFQNEELSSFDNDEENDDDDDLVEEHYKWSTKLVQGITSFTHNLIFSGPALHFDETDPLAKEGQDPYFVKDKRIRDSSQKRFLRRFTLHESEKLVATYHAYLTKGLPSYGKLYIGNTVVCFRSTMPGTSTIMILPVSDIETVNKESGFSFGYSGLVVIIRGHEELFFEFSSTESRDDCEIHILKQLDAIKKQKHDGSKSSILPASDAHQFALYQAKISMVENRLNTDIGLSVPIIIEDHPLSKTEIKPKKSVLFTLLTIGSRGDVQPYIALGKALLKEGHRVKIVTHKEFEDWIRSYGLDFDEIAGDPSELMALMVTHPNINYSFIKEAKTKFREWIDDLLTTSWKACQDTDVLIESPSSIAGIHIAEKLQIPYFRAFTMPWTRTRAYPHAFLVPDQKLGGAYNYMTHVAFENGYWRGTCYQVNKWRVETLGIPKTSLAEMRQSSIPFLYNMSPVVFPPSLDFPEWVKVTGYWFLDESNNYEPPPELVAFMKKAKNDGKKLVYIGFGSIVVENPKELTKSIVDAVLESDVRCIMNKGWSDRLESKNKKDVEIELPPEVFHSGNIPHDWLFTHIDAAVHHGGSGTTGASLRFGLPTIIKPFFGDQKFYAGRVEDLGCGIGLKTLDSKDLAKALREVTTNSRIIERAKSIGETIRAENGVDNAITNIYTMMDYAKKVSVRKYKEVIKSSEESDYNSNDVIQSEMEDSWLLV